MAFFKFRKGGEELAPASPPVQSIDLMRRRAKHRLIGAALLVLLGVIGFPLVFDNQPRPVYVDIPIEIPDRNKVKPLTIPAPAPPAPVAEPVAPAAAPSAPAPAPAVAREAAASAAAAPAAAAPAALARAASAAAATASAAPSAPLSKPAPTAADKAAPASAAPGAQARPDDGAKAQALLEGRESPAISAGAEARFVVQVGAFAEEARAREVRLKLERAGLKTYTHVAETKDGPRTRVRVGPFADKAEAQRVAEKVRALDLPAAILTL